MTEASTTILLLVARLAYAPFGASRPEACCGGGGEAAAGRRRHAMVDGGGSWSAVVDGGDSLGGTRARARLASKGAAAAAEWDDRGEHDCV